MSLFGKNLKEYREKKNLSQYELSKLINANHSIIGKYERNEVKPSIEVAKKLANVLGTSVGYLLGENQEYSFTENTQLVKRINNILSLPVEEQEHIFYTVDAMVKAAKLKDL